MFKVIRTRSAEEQNSKRVSDFDQIRLNSTKNYFLVENEPEGIRPSELWSGNASSGPSVLRPADVRVQPNQSESNRIKVQGRGARELVDGETSVLPAHSFFRAKGAKTAEMRYLDLDGERDKMPKNDVHTRVSGPIIPKN